jgi:flagellar M-ring protein FliF
MDSLLKGFQEFFKPLNTAQRTMFVSLAAVIVIFIGALFYWSLQPEYTLLFGSLGSESANEIVEDLDEQGIKYRVENGGQSIYVQSGEVHELRMKMASKGVKGSDVQGYELFDTNALGMTDFMQQVNNKRALEGEIARTINSLEQVEFSRIHLVLPERSPFRESSVEASASVILNMKRGKSLKNDQIEGITALIAGSVEGLEATAVTVLDQNGNRLTDGLQQNADYASGSIQMQLRQNTENYLTERGQTMLDRVLGHGNSILRVSAEHDFDRLLRESEIIDPDSRTIISEERRSDVNTNEQLQQVPIDEFTPVDQRGETVVVGNTNQENSTQTRNYEVNRTREVYEKTQGEIKRLSASVLINYKQSIRQGEDGQTETVSEPYSEEEIEEFREIVRLALGIQPGRGDELSITQVEFYDPTAQGSDPYFQSPPITVNDWIRWIIILVTIGMIIYLIISIRKRLGGELEGALVKTPESSNQFDDVPYVEEEKNMEDLDEEEYEDFIDRKLSGKARKQLEQKEYALEEIRDFIELKPSEASKVIRAYMTLEEED